MHGIISVFLYLLRLALCPMIWSILKKFPWVAEKMYILQKLDEIFCQLGPFDLWCDLVLGFLNDFLFGWPIYWWWWVLKSPTTIVLESIYAFWSFRVCLMKLDSLILGDNCYFLLVYFPFYLYGVSFFSSFEQCKFEVYFIWDKYCYSCLFSGAVGLVNLLPSFHPKPVLVSVNEVGLL
jgi:hypothetical protein